MPFSILLIGILNVPSNSIVRDPPRRRQWAHLLSSALSGGGWQSPLAVCYPHPRGPKDMYLLRHHLPAEFS